MIELTKRLEDSRELVAEIERRSGEQLSACYQCGTCTSTCAANLAFDYPPHVMMRLLQLGLVDEAMSSRTAQLCYDCMTCSSRCPIRIDVADIIETVKNMADERGMPEPERPLSLFRNLFLRNVSRHGRLHEASLLFWFNIKSGKLFNDLSLVPLVLRKKKVHIHPSRIRNRQEIKRIFAVVKNYPKLKK